MGNYEKYPSVPVKGWEGRALKGYDDIMAALREEYRESGRADYCIVFDTYPGVWDEEVLEALRALRPDNLIQMKEVFKGESELTEQLRSHLTDDRVFGRMYYGEIEDLLNEEALKGAKEKAKQAKGLTVVYGFGAGLVAEADTLVYLDMARWEIQLRYRKGMPNFNCSNTDEDTLRKYKRAFFIEWRIADKYKQRIFERIDHFLDTNRRGKPVMVSGEAVRAGLCQMTERPFRTVPYFDPGVWGGQWMKEVCGLDRDRENFAWSFDGVPEENSILLDFGNGKLELPAMDLVLYQPKKLLGPQVFARFGAEFPIRFDFLDTMGGQNLSLQVHPLTEYIHRQFGMAYTQDESYYLLDAGEDACVYLGLTDEAEPEEMFEELEKANRGECLFDAEKFINKFPAKKHDHFLIPAGTCHCSGANSMVLEISATPYIFTFKLWDWARVGLDGKPRPVHLKHGRQVIQWDRKTEWVKENLVNAVYTVEENQDYKEEHTGLHELEFIETRRYWIRNQAVIRPENTVNMLNLVEGEEAIVESPKGAFEPFTVHYAETFIIPAGVEEYSIRSAGEGTIGVIRAYVRKQQS
ncbi:class I mannose-6-phosphate isomerase [Lacrimispora sp. 210928-DFI.3.58]|uniref:class I mannose-6-phosphate isomerase n=1 Tax=Lacrimispora sp. 210928-DFI.3.58 TaxID=2883214 RepID=UPI001D068581|nr:class I mannose-6-phosphate isomerase [Lacrimispora sp. 210928-DFI.3.58]MCB7321127.1 class I mannose-6-phosphate isomerase [Lacrimispora sp. 210928-DFI.3.58]